MTSNEFKNYFKSRFINCSDFAIRESYSKSGKIINILYIINLCDKKYITDSILKPISDNEIEFDLQSVKNVFASLPLTECAETSTAEKLILSGNAIIFGGDNGTFFAFAADSKNESGRSISEPETESVVRGPRQGFVESAEVNVTLIRKIIKSADLKVITEQCGTDTSTTVKIMYFDGIADIDTVNEIVGKIRSLEISSCIDSGYIEERLQCEKLYLFSGIGNSEKPDKVASKILGGRIAVICDGSPIVLTAPYLFIEGLQSSEDYLKNKFYASFIRILRILCFFLSVFLPGLYVAVLDFHKGALPYSLYKIQQLSRSDVPFDIFFEMLIVLIVFEILREVGVRMPKAVGNTVSIVGGLILGDTAIKAGIASETIIFVAAFAGITNFMNPTFMNANVILRFFVLVFAKIFGYFGISASFLLILAFLSNKRSFKVPYLSPFIPIKNNVLEDTVFVSLNNNKKKSKEKLS